MQLETNLSLNHGMDDWLGMNNNVNIIISSTK